jgi:hypothetical protein
VSPHTPGPWRHVDGEIVGPPSIDILVAIMPEQGLGTDTPVGRAFNAFLIAAAPELLAALEAVAEFWAGGDVPPELDAQMKAAIAKARGRA